MHTVRPRDVRDSTPCVGPPRLSGHLRSPPRGGPGRRGRDWQMLGHAILDTTHRYAELSPQSLRPPPTVTVVPCGPIVTATSSLGPRPPTDAPSAPTTPRSAPTKADASAALVPA